MSQTRRLLRLIASYRCVAAACVITISVATFAVEASTAESEDTTTATASPKFAVELVRGKVVWYATALDRLLGIKATSDAKHNTLAIETVDGRLVPLIDDLRARAFRKDDRLRQMQVELLVRRYESTPSLQVLKLFQVKGDETFQLDYWCDICAIVMFERGACACCQDDNRLRKRLVETP